MEGWLIFVAGILTLVGIYSIVTMALNLEFGKAGLIDLGIVAFFGVGAYAYTLLTVKAPGPGDYYLIGLNLPIWAGIIGAVLVAAGFAYLVGLPTLRLGGEYLAIATYAFAEVIRQIFANEYWLTNGVVGFNGISQPFQQYFNSSTYQFMLMFIIMAIVLVVFLFLQRPPGRQQPLTKQKRAS